LTIDLLNALSHSKHLSYSTCLISKDGNKGVGRDTNITLKLKDKINSLPNCTTYLFVFF